MASRRSHRLSGFRAPVTLCLLHGFAVLCEGNPVPLPASAQRVAAFLALQARPLSRTYVAGVLWPNASEQHSRANLRTALWRLMKPGVRVVEAESGAIGIAAGVDVDLRRCAERARLLAVRPDDWREDDIELLATAGDALLEFYDDWAVTERERFRQLRVHALEALSDHLRTTGRYASAVELGLAAVAADPLRESGHRAVIEAHLAEGNRAEALDQYKRYRVVLRQELGLEASPAMAALVASGAGRADTPGRVPIHR